MAIKIYREESKELKTPMIRDIGGYSDFVDKEGKTIAIYRYSGIRCTQCKQLLIDNGYRTDFAEWDDEGCLVRFLEEIV
jgi:hypothetical protein